METNKWATTNQYMIFYNSNKKNLCFANILGKIW